MNAPRSQAGLDIAVIGMAGRLPDANTLAEFWDNLRNGRESVRRFTKTELLRAGERPDLIADPDYVAARPVLTGADLFDAAFFGFSPQDAAVMDPQHRVFLEVGWEALEDAGHDAERFSGSIGVFATCGMNAYMMYHLVTNQRIMDTVGEWLVRHTGNDMNFLATRLSYAMGLKGPSLNVQSACSSALVAVHLASQSLLNGECDMALAGGAVVALPQDRGYLYKKDEILSPDGHCRPFDAKAQGTLFGSGAGVVVLRRLSDALADRDHIYAVIKGSAINNDGAMKVGYLAPSVEGQSRAIVEALDVSGVDPETVSYIEAHGTGTLVGDPIEIAALTEAFRHFTAKSGFCAIGSLKSNIGHLGEAAGVAGLIKTVLSLQHREIPPSLHYETPNPRISFTDSPFFVNAVRREWTTTDVPRRAGITSLGAGGTNAHVIVEEAPLPEPSGPSRPTQLLLLSAKSAPALEAASERLATFLQTSPAVPLADVAYTLQVGRKNLRHRRAIICGAREEAIQRLRTPQQELTAIADGPPRPVVFLFPGQGAQYPQMGRGLYDEEPIFRKSFDECADLFAARSSDCLRTLVFAEDSFENATRLDRTAVTQPALFAVEYALARLWMSWGVHPSSLIGHSVGEYVAACLAGVFSLADAMALISLRGALMQALPPGAMLSVAQPADEIAQRVAGTSLSVAAHNGPTLSVVSGTEAAVAAFAAALQAQGIECQRLHTSHAFHSAMMDPILDRFREAVSAVPRQPPSRPFVSNLTGDWIRPEQATDPDYWASHLRSTVRFKEGLATLIKTTRDSLMIEVGPGRALATLARQQPDKPAAAVPSLRHPKEDTPDGAVMLQSLGRLWLNGVNPDWNAFYEREHRVRVSLPAYPFQRQRYWIPAGNPLAAPAGGVTALTGDKAADVADWFSVPVWNRVHAMASSDPHAGDLLVFADDCGLGRAVAAALTRAQSTPDSHNGTGYSLEFATPGDPDHASLTTIERLAPGEGEVEVQVRAAALNFADVLKVTGLQPDAPFGMEAAGVVARIGPGVTAVNPGDEVVTIGPESFRSHILRDARFVAPKPQTLTWEDAATIPAAFMTAWFALSHLARIASGERVLIHAASGGVGLAAIQVARRAGARIYATAGSERKRAFLRSLGIEHVFSSRSIDFADEIARATSGAGVDVVLNSLTGEFIPKSLRLLARGGRFLEIGKREIYSHEQLRSVGLQPDVAYLPIDLTSTLRDDPDLYGRLLVEVMSHIRSGVFTPLHRTVFDVSDAVDAFRLMIQARHIGKVVLSFGTRGVRAYIVEPGDRFAQLDRDRFALNPAEPADYVALLNAIGPGASRLRHIVHLWNLGPTVASDAIDPVLQRAFFSPLFVAQAIGRQELNQPIRLSFVTTGVFQVSAEHIEPTKAAVVGPAFVIPRELPNVRSQIVDVLPAATEWQRLRIVDQVARELQTAGTDRAVAYRGIDRWVQSYEPVRLAPPSRPLFKDRGVYLITGGFGALGLEVASHLVANAEGARLILIGRTAPPASSRWTSWLSSHPEDDLQSRRIRRLQALEAAGAELFLGEVDVADERELRNVLERARTTFGPIHGVFHAAGRLADGPMQVKAVSSAEGVLRPKIQGVLALEAALREQPPDFLVLFSSASSILGLEGQVDYTAANAVLDAYAHARSVDGPTRVVSVNWGAWRDVGIAADASKSRHRGGRPDGPDHPWLDRSRKGPDGETIFIMTVDRRHQWVIAEHVIRGGDALLPGTGYLELARGAAGSLPDGGARALTNIYFETPFVVREDEPRDLEIVLRPDGDEQDFSIRSAAGTHVTGRVSSVSAIRPTTLDLAAIARRCQREEATVDGYLAQDFMDFGPRWANIARLQFGDQEALVTLTLPPSFASELGTFSLHPALLDMATGAAQRLIPDFDGARDFYVPFSYGRIIVYKGFTERAMSHVRLREGSGRGTAFFDVTICDERGQVLIDITGFCMQRVVDRQALTATLAASQTAAVRSPDWSGSKVAEAMLATSMTVPEGLEALDRVLAASPAPQIVVSPVALAYWNQRLETRERQPEPPAVTATATLRATHEGPPAPSGDIEARLHRMWSELLGVERVGRRDNFFEIGGHSLLAVRLLTRIEKTFKKSIPLQSLFQSPTIAELSALLGGSPDEPPARPAVIVPINEHGVGPIFYCVHSLGGDVFCFRFLAKALGSGQRLSGIQAPLSEGAGLGASIESLAARYVEALIASQPEGPYILGGWSAGSSIALEMAQQLMATGRRVDLLVALDGAPLNTGAERRPWNPIYQLKLLKNLPLWILDDLIPEFSLAGLLKRVYKKGIAVTRSAAATWAGRDHAGDEVEGFLDTSLWSAQEQRFMRELNQALQRYVPKPYAGSVLLYQSRTEPLYHLFEVDRVWRRLSKDVTVVPVTGTHISLVRDPHVARIAQDLRARLTSFRRTPASGAAAQSAQMPVVS